MVDGVDVSQLAPDDCIAALRSYPRRYRAALMPVRDDDAWEDKVHRIGPDGRSPLDHADHAARAIGFIGRAMEQVLVHDNPTLLAGVVDDAAREWAVTGATATVEAILDFVTTECEALADRASHVPPTDWARRGAVAGRAESLTALDVLREAVRVGSNELRAIERALSA